jgi:hypothetical protein
MGEIRIERSLSIGCLNGAVHWVLDTFMNLNPDEHIVLSPINGGGQFNYLVNF